MICMQKWQCRSVFMYEIVWAALRSAPNRAYLEFEAHPAVAQQKENKNQKNKRLSKASSNWTRWCW